VLLKEIFNANGCVNVVLSVAVQPKLSVTTTDILPALRPVALLVVAAIDSLKPLDQL